jgi:hypothetical protein
MSLKWILITIGLMILAYAVIHALFVFAWMIHVGFIAGIVVLIVIAYFKLRAWLNNKSL